MLLILLRIILSNSFKQMYSSEMHGSVALGFSGWLVWFEKSDDVGLFPDLWDLLGCEARRGELTQPLCLSVATVNKELWIDFIRASCLSSLPFLLGLFYFISFDCGAQTADPVEFRTLFSSLHTSLVLHLSGLGNFPLETSCWAMEPGAMGHLRFPWAFPKSLLMVFQASLLEWVKLMEVTISSHLSRRPLLRVSISYSDFSCVVSSGDFLTSVRSLLHSLSQQGM